MNSRIKNRLRSIIFETDSTGGKIFDVFLIIAIVVSVVVVILDSVPELNKNNHTLFVIIEWTITFIFTLEYFLRILVSRKPLSYIFSFYGIIDLLATVPSYLGILFTGGASLLVFRSLRLLRIFRVFKLSRYTSAGYILRKSLNASKAKIGVFLTVVTTTVIIIGTIMYLVEGSASGFTSIPKGIYWTIVTITTVGYGDIAPLTGLGQFIASLTMLTGYAIIAVPTGIVTAEISEQNRLIRKEKRNTTTCNTCLNDDHDNDARYCKNCGTELPDK